MPTVTGRGRALGPALAAAAVGAAILFVLAGPLGVTSGLLIVAVATGWITGLALKAQGAAGPAGRRVGTAVAIALAAVVIAWAATWAFSRVQGGALGPIDFLAQVYGAMLLLQAAFAAAGAVLGAR
jgi:hypothetical protein